VPLPTIPAFSFSKPRMRELAAQLNPLFTSAEPFHHVVIEDFLPDDIARAIAAEFPTTAEPIWRVAGPGDTRHSGDPDVEKISCSNIDAFPPLTRHVVNEFNSGVMVEFIEGLSGFSNICTDPSLYGAGLHSTGRGGRLMIHADASRHRNTKLHQVVNMIYYCTPDWQPEWRGDLELWDRDCTRCEKSVSPKFNSALFFRAGTNSYHGHPHPVESPPGIRRNSIAIYYYTTDRPTDEDYSGFRNFADWRPTRPEDRQRSFYHAAKFAARQFAPARLTNALASVWRKARSTSTSGR